MLGEPSEPLASPVLIVGGGLAGLFSALKLAPRPVTVLTCAPIGEGASSAWAQGGIAAALRPSDSPEKHAADTVAAGAGIVDADLALAVAREARARVDDLVRFGVPFDRDAAGTLVQSREAAHSEWRIARVRGDMAGKAIMAALVEAVAATPSITLVQDHTAHAFIVHNGRVAGVRAVGPDGRERAFAAAATVLATGGIGHLYAVSTNPPQARGSGLAMAARAGAVIADAEFVQFHPTAVAIGRDPAPLATEALRGEGAILVNDAGTRFMTRWHADAELAPRDIVARGVFAEIAAGRGAYLDARTALGETFAAHFPTVYAACRSGGIDPARMPIPVAPAAHYHMGGVWTDENGRTSLRGLWAAGEVASTGLHGANRLASNSLLEAVVFADRVARDIAACPAPVAAAPCDPDAPVTRMWSRDETVEEALVRRLRELMSARVGVIREEAGLARALTEIREIEAAAATPDLRDMATTALIVTAAAMLRRESRGGHYRSDYPHADPALAHASRITLAQVRAVADNLKVAA